MQPCEDSLLEGPSSRWRCEHRVRMLLNYVVVYLQWLHLSQPAGGVLVEAQLILRILPQSRTVTH
eukprot:1855417-Amphidinium_carterae.1